MPTSYAIGNRAERRAAEYLQEQGLEVIDQNVRKKCGEIDLIAKDKSIWICIEVKYRESSEYGHPLEMVNRQKLSRMIRAFTLYLLDKKLNPAHTAMRFDVIAVEKDKITWLRNVTL